MTDTPKVTSDQGGYWGPLEAQSDGSKRQKWIFTDPDHPSNNPESLVTKTPAVTSDSPKKARKKTPKVTSDSTKKPRKPRAKRVTSDSTKKPKETKVLPFIPKEEESLVTQGGMKWKVADGCGCWLPQEPGFEWRKFENGHRLLPCIGYGISKTGKRVKRRGTPHYFTHRAMRIFVEKEYGIEAQHAAKA